MSSASLRPAGEPDPDSIVTAVLDCSTVAGLSGGAAGEIATYLPGRRVAGLRIDATRITVHVVGRYGPTMTEISNQVTRAVTPLGAGRQVGVVIEDLQVEDRGSSPTAAPPDPHRPLADRPPSTRLR